MNAQEGCSTLPVQVAPHDALRQGLSALKQDVEVSHPVEAIQDNVSGIDSAIRCAAMRNIEATLLLQSYFQTAAAALFVSFSRLTSTAALRQQYLCVQLRKQQEQSRSEMLSNLYGSALPARMQIERQILRKCVFAPCLPISARAAAVPLLKCLRGYCRPAQCLA